jgi:formamidopyrimidine-DNA glycosylase
MSGSFRIIKNENLADYKIQKHDHVIFELFHEQHKNFALIYKDPRRFGFMNISFDIENNKFLKKLGVEPLGNHFNANYLVKKFNKSSKTIKSALLDQSIIAGLGNIYVCETLWRVAINPKLPVHKLVKKDAKATKKLETLVPAIVQILNEAIKAGGSTLKDFSNSDGKEGYFQHSFDVYGREGLNCNNPSCSSKITRISQSGRSTFYCQNCQSL